MTKRSVALAAVAVIVAACAAVFVAGWQLAQPVPAVIGPAPRRLQAESIAFASESGATIHGWFSRGTPQHGAVLLLPGVRSNRLAMVERAVALRAHGYSTLLIDFQATGESRGDAITFGWRERFDVVAALEMLQQLLPGEPVGVIGVSLGGAATVLAAPALKIDAAVLEAVYPSIDVAVENRLRMRLGPVGAALSPLLLLQLGARLGVSPDDLKPVDRISALPCPVLVVGGVIDEHTTEADTRRLYTAAREPKELWLIPDAAHVDYYQTHRAEYDRRVFGFLKRALGVPD